MILAAIALAAQIDHIANEAVRNGPTAGLSIAVVRHGRVIVANGYGLSNVELGVPARANTVYHADSITKHLTAGAILCLVGRKQLSLDDPITKYVKLPAAWTRVSIRELLDHTSGSASYTSLPSWGPQERLDVSQDEVLALVRDEPFAFEPGTAWRYNNTGFYLLGMVIEKVTGKSYGEAMRELVFAPLQMTSTEYCGYRPVIRHRAAGYEVEHGKLVNAAPTSWSAPFAVGAICSTVRDLARYERGLERHRLFNAALLSEMRMPTQVAGAGLDYGLGTRLGHLGRHAVAGHTGNGGGFRNILESFPDDDLIIVVLSNTENSSISASMVATRIARLILDVPDASADLPVAPADLNAWTGHYVTDDGNIETIPIGDNHLGFRPAPDGPLIPMRYDGNGTFTVAPEVTVHFHGGSGETVWAQSYTGGLFTDASRRAPRGPATP